MIQNYLKTAFRNIARNKLFSAINIFGLAIGMACSILIFLWVKDELSFDRYHQNVDNIYRVVMEKNTDGNMEKIARTPPPVGRILKDEFPEIISCTRFFYMNLGFYADVEVFQEHGSFVDSDIFTMFEINLIKGDTSSAFTSNTNLIISEKLALKVFNTTDVLGKDIRVGAETVFTISGVFEDFPSNSHINVEYLAKYDLLFEFGLPREMWDNYNNNHYTYVLLDEKSSLTSVNDKIKDVITRNASTLKANIFLQPLKDVYLKSDFKGDYDKLGNLKNVYIFSIISIFILLIAGFNFMNLTTAQATKRSKEIGVRKVMGAKRKSLIKQFLGEALLLTFIAHFFAIILIELSLPAFNLLTSKDLSIDYFNIDFYVMIGLVILIIGLFSGSYPSLYLSGLNALTVFKEKGLGNKKGNFLRRSLVIIQFVISISLITGSLVIWLQLNFLNNKDLGFKKSELLYFSLPNHGEKYEELKERLIQYPGIKNATVLSHELTDVVHLDQVSWEGKQESDKVLMNMLWVDEDFIKTMEMELADGENFNKKHKEDTNTTFLVNEAAVREMNLENPVGKRFTIGRWNGYIGGVVKDFNFQPLYNDVKPMILCALNHERYYLYVRIVGKQREKMISIIKEEFNKFAPDTPFNYFFLEDEIEEMYKSEHRLAKLTKYSTLITILISCLGLFGLISFMAERRTKEIGIRKTLGASVKNIVFILSKEIVVWILVANAISWPITYYFISKWLNNFSYKIDLNIMPFLISGLIAILIALLTLNIKAISAANKNPVDALRYE